jgi:hypothetical protein
VIDLGLEGFKIHFNLKRIKKLQLCWILDWLVVVGKLLFGYNGLDGPTGCSLHLSWRIRIGKVVGRQRVRRANGPNTRAGDIGFDGLLVFFFGDNGLDGITGPNCAELGRLDS